jgi:hypothetical protein
VEADPDPQSAPEPGPGLDLRSSAGHLGDLRAVVGLASETAVQSGVAGRLDLLDRVRSQIASKPRKPVELLVGVAGEAAGGVSVKPTMSPNRTLTDSWRSAMSDSPPQPVTIRCGAH